ncbi:uncharacterized protein LOC106023661 isoform X2 [Esox lucius]|uniref:uncharacterized protein LOC106023661 isoform X2 n=1 Tax=Esox lucius TaxID=8010 RepID=UPI001476B0E8|nr:uncharacterized protein LOC106023661 isoform X2 [Esox lucius]
MDHFFIIKVTILLVLCPAGSEVLTVTGVVGGRVDIRCYFRSLEINIKYFCKHPCRTESDVIIKTRVSNNYIEGRYSIADHGNGHVTVIIKDLKRSDSGTYWCGVMRVGIDAYQEVYLSVVEAPPTQPDITRTSLRPPVTVSRTTDVITTDVLIYMGAGLVVVVCLLVLLLLIFLGLRNRSKTRTGSCPSKMITSNTQFTTSANQHSDTHDINSNHATATNQCQDDIYCNIDSSTEAPDSVSYVTVNFPRDPSCVQYDTVNFPRDPSCLQYDTVNIPRDPSCLQYDTVNIPRDPSCVQYDTANIPRDPSCLQYDTVNFPRDPSCLQYDTVNFSRDPSCLQYDTVNIPRDPSCLQYDTVNFIKDSDVRNQPDSVIYSSVRIQHSNHEMVTYSAIKPKCSQ